MAKVEVITRESIETARDSFEAAKQALEDFQDDKDVEISAAISDAETATNNANQAVSDLQTNDQQVQDAIAEAMLHSDVDANYISYEIDVLPDSTDAVTDETIGLYFKENGIVQKVLWDGSEWDEIGEGAAGKKYVDDKVSLSPFVNLKEAFGSKGDGSTNDTDAIKDALAYLKSKSGGVLFIPNGTYMINDHIDIPSNVVIIGESRKAIIKAIEDTVFEAVSFRDGVDVGFDLRRWHRYMLAPETRGDIGTGSNIEIHNITVDWNNCPAYDSVEEEYASPCPVWIDSVESVLVENIAVINALEDAPVTDDSGAGTYRGTAFSVTQSKHVHVEKCYFGSAHYRSVEVLAEAQHVTFNNCVLETKNPWRHSLEFASHHAQADEGTWLFDNYGPVTFTNNTVIALPANGQFDVFSSHGARNVTFEDNTIVIMGAGAVTMRAVKVFDGSENVSVKRNKIYMLGVYESGSWTGLWAALRAYQLGNDSPTGDAICRDISFDDNHIFVKSQRDTSMAEWCLVESMNETEQYNVSVDNNKITIFDLAEQTEHPIISFAGQIFSVSKNKFRFASGFTGTAAGPTLIKIRAHARDGFIGGNIASKNADFRKGIEVHPDVENVIVTPDNMLQGDTATEWIDADNDVYNTLTGRVSVMNKESRALLNLSLEEFDGMPGWYLYTSGILGGDHHDIIIRSTVNILKIHGGESSDASWIEMLQNNIGLIFRSADGTRYKVTVTNAGELDVSTA